jgi:hypothetical protein
MARERWAGLLSFDQTDTQAVGLGMERLELWDYAFDGPGADANLNNYSLSVKQPGTYFFNFNASVDGPNSSSFVFEVFKNGGSIGFGAEVVQPAAHHTQNVSIIGAYNMEVGDVLSVYFRANGNHALTLRYGQFGIFSM